MYIPYAVTQDRIFSRKDGKNKKSLIHYKGRDTDGPFLRVVVVVDLYILGIGGLGDRYGCTTKVAYNKVFRHTYIYIYIYMHEMEVE